MNRFSLTALFVAALVPAGSWAGTPAQDSNPHKERDRQAILAMAGTFVVDFHFEETVGFPMGYELRPAYDASALEIVVIVENSENKIVLQHVLQTEKRIIKHWRQDWEYENRTLWEYQGNRQWRKRDLSAAEAKGTWTQRVFQVDDSPRYESHGVWTHIGDLSQWESAMTYRPLPRREYTKRDDYDILAARNRQALTQSGWVHEQDNYKLKLGDPNQVLAREIGLNRYVMTREGRCEQTRQWWMDRAPFWADVREVWTELFEGGEMVTLQKELEGKPLYRQLFDLAEAHAGKDGYRKEAAKASIRKTIEPYLTLAPASGTLANQGVNAAQEQRAY